MFNFLAFDLHHGFFFQYFSNFKSMIYNFGKKKNPFWGNLAKLVVSNQNYTILPLFGQTFRNLILNNFSL